MYQNEYSANECGLNCVVSIEYLMWKRCTFHLGHGMWFTSSRVLSDLGIFLHPLEHTSALMPRTPKIIVSSHLGSLEVYLGVYLCVFSGKLWKREKIIWRSLTCVFSRRGLMYDLHFFWFWDKLRTILLISCFFLI